MKCLNRDQANKQFDVIYNQYLDHSKKTHKDFFASYRELNNELAMKSYEFYEVVIRRDQINAIVIQNSLINAYSYKRRIEITKGDEKRLRLNSNHGMFDEHIFKALRLIPQLDVYQPLPKLYPCKEMKICMHLNFRLKSKCLMMHFAIKPMREFYKSNARTKMQLNMFDSMIWAFFSDEWPQTNTCFYFSEPAHPKNQDSLDRLMSWSEMDDCNQCHGIELDYSKLKDCDGMNQKAIKIFYESKLWKKYCNNGKTILRRCQVINFLKDHLTTKKSEVCKICYD